jgi:NAD(P)-dependent dehydrogenase (short-subunit alcohol dehydrogenase family)
MIVPNRFQAAADALANRNILVTGAGDGIGRAASLSFAAHGATVILLGRTQAKLEQVHDEIVAAGGSSPLIQVTDLASADERQYHVLADAVESELGCLHGLLHNAALLGPRRPLQQYPLATWLELMQVNLNAAFQLTRALIPALQRASDASVVFTTSGVGRRARAYWGAYAVSKFGVEGLCQLFAEELAATTRIRVNCLNPGATNTAMRRAAYPAEEHSRNPAPERIMAAYLYLMSDASIGVNGQSLEAQGG